MAPPTSAPATPDTRSVVMGAMGGDNASKALFGERFRIEDEAAQKASTDRKAAQEKMDTDVERSRQDVKDAAARTGALVPPVLEPAPVAQKTDVMSQFGSAAMVAAVAFGRMARAPATAMLNASAGVMGAFAKKDLETAQAQFATWKTNTDNMLKIAEFQQRSYEDALSTSAKDQNLAIARFNAAAAGIGDDVALAKSRAGGIDGAIQHLDNLKRIGATLESAKPQMEKLYHEREALLAVQKARDAVLAAQQSGNPEQVKTAQTALERALQNQTDVNRAFNPGYGTTELRGAQNTAAAAQKRADALEKVFAGKPAAGLYNNWKTEHPDATVEQQLDFLHRVYPAGVNPFMALMGGLGGGPAAAAGGTKDAPAKPTTQAEFDKLPSGAYYIDPDDNQQYQKP